MDANTTTNEVVEVVEAATVAAPLIDAAAASAAADASASPKTNYIGSRLGDAQSKFNSWGSGIPRGRYSDVINDSNSLETFGYQTNADGSVKVNDKGQPVSLNRADGSPQANGRYIQNLATGGKYKLYNSQLAALTPTQLLDIRDTEKDAVVFDNVELELEVVKDGDRSSFKFNM